MKVLVVDDSQAMRAYVKECLREQSFAIEVAKDGLHALQVISEASKMGTPFDLICLDWEMPRLDGMGVLNKIRNHSTLSSTKVLMITGRNKVEDIQRCILEGAQDYLMKPFTKDILLDKLHKATLA